MDLAFVLDSYGVKVVFGTGTGSFGSPISIPIAPRVEGITAGDFNEDGIGDLAVTSNSQGTVNILLGTGTGFSGPTVIPVIAPVSDWWQGLGSLEPGDFNGDGHLDLVVVRWNGGSFYVLLGDGTGGFGSPIEFAMGFSGGYKVRVADFNGDGNLDLAVASDATSIAVFLNRVTAPVNEPPVANANGPYIGNEGSAITFDASASTDPDGRIVKYEWDLDGDGEYDDATGVTATHTWNDDYSGTIGLRVTDDNGLTSTASTSVTVGNVPPTVDAGPDQTVDEGATVSFNGGFSDPGRDAYTIKWDFGDGGTTTGTLTPTHAYGDDGVYTVTLTVDDGDGGIGGDTLKITVNNVVPTVEAGPDQTVYSGDIVRFSGSFSDPGWLDTHTILWDFGDGTTGSGVTGSHVYTMAGTYTVILTVTDNDGATGTDTSTVTVQTPAEATTDLISDVKDLNLPAGIENSLTSKLESAINSLDMSQENAAKNKLNAFINQVQAQRGKKIASE